MNDYEDMTGPVDPTEEQLADLVAGKAVEFGEPTRPRVVGDDDVEALGAGKEVRIEEFPTLRREEKPPGLVHEEATEAGLRPAALTDEEVKALREGKDIGIGDRARLEAQY